jgi:repressor LexA
MNDLTSKQAEILEFLKKCRQDGEPGPTYREIAGHFGFKSPKAAADHVNALEKKGFVRRHVGRSRGIEVLSYKKQFTNDTIAIPILGNIQAGYPDAQAEHLNGTLAVDETMLGSSKGHKLFALKVNGDSMEGRGIFKGDWVIADSDAAPHQGYVVVALIDGQNTLKTLAEQKDRYFLKAENLKYSDLIPVREMVIQGVVIAVFRRINLQ